MYILDIGKDFWKGYKKLVRGNNILLKNFQKTLKQLSKDPFYNSLRTHKVNTKKYNNVYSSSLTGDVRIIWKFDDKEELVILILETGNHSGASQIYQRKSA